MQFHSKREYVQLLLFALFGMITIFNPTIVLSLKQLFVVVFLIGFFFTMTRQRVTITKDSIQHAIEFLSFTILHRLIPVESIEKIEKINDKMKLHHKHDKNINFAIDSPEFISAIEAFCVEHHISIMENDAKKKA